VAQLDAQSGRPLGALVAIQALADLGDDPAPLRESLAMLYAADSPRIARVGARLAPPSPDEEIDPPPPERARDDVGAAARSAVALAADTTSIREFPSVMQPVPLLSELSAPALLRILDCALVRRLVHGQPVIRAGDPGDGFYLLASGCVRVWRPGVDGAPVELARLYEGALFGEMAIIHAEPRSASVDVVGAADLVFFGREAIRAAADELPTLAATLVRYARERLVRNVAHTAPLFAPYPPGERLELLKRFTLREVEPGEVLVERGADVEELLVVVAGALDLLAGEPPFDEVVARVGPGDVACEGAMLARAPSDVTVRADGRTLVLSLARGWFDRLTLAVPEVKAFLDERAAERRRLAPRHG
jgi:CRP-like cAMP-binding protein